MSKGERTLERYLFHVSNYESDIKKCEFCHKEETDGHSFHFIGSKLEFCSIECLKEFFIKETKEVI